MVQSSLLFVDARRIHITHTLPITLTYYYYQYYYNYYYYYYYY